MKAIDLFAAHAAACPRCKAVDLSRSATYAETCLTGASMALDAARELEREQRKSPRVGVGEEGVE